MDFALSSLIGWSRRQSTDQPLPYAELLIGNGGSSYTLNNDGSIDLTSVTLDQVDLNLSEVTASGSQLFFNADVDTGVNIDVNYNRSQYDDDQLKDFLCDAAIGVGIDLDIHWLVDYQTSTITNIDEAEFVLAYGNTISDLDPVIQRLIVIKVDSIVASDKSNAATDDAIMIKDGDTTINTSLGSGAQGKSMERKQAKYQVSLTQALRRRFSGKRQLY